MNKVKVPLKENVQLIQTRDGKEINRVILSNLVVDTGRAGAASRLNGAGSESAFTYIAIGTGTTAVTVADTALIAEITTGGGARASATCARVTTDTTNDTAQMQKTFTFTLPFAVTETGVFNASTAGTMLNRAVFSALNLISGDQLTVIHQFDID